MSFLLIIIPRVFCLHDRFVCALVMLRKNPGWLLARSTIIPWDVANTVSYCLKAVYKRGSGRTGLFTHTE